MHAHNRNTREEQQMDNVTRREELRQMIECVEEIQSKRMHEHLSHDMQQMVDALKDHFEALRRVTPLTNNSTGYTPEACQHAIKR